MDALGGISPKPDALCGGPSMARISVRHIPDLKRIHVEPASDGHGLGGCTTLTQIWESLLLLPQQNSPVYAINTTTNAVSDVPTGTWLLTEDLYIEGGITLGIVGAERGGDADEVRLLSNFETFLNLRGNGGSLSFENTRVLSWDDAIDGPDHDFSDGRSYVSCLSEIITDESLSPSCERRAEAAPPVGECRMDIQNSEMAHLGYDAEDSWGVSSIVRDFCNDNNDPETLDNVISVRGTVIDSHLHHNYHGYFALGSLGGNWIWNTVHNNMGDGFHAREYSRNLVIAANNVYDNGNYGIVGSNGCSDLAITQNIVQGNKIGIFLHRVADRAIVQRNFVNVCSEAGIAMHESSRGVISGNVLLQSTINVRVSSGSSGNVFENNVIRHGKRHDISVYEGSRGSDIPPLYRASRRPKNNIFSKNKFERSRTVDSGVHIKNADGTQFVENLIFDGPWNFFIEDSKNFVFSGNFGYDRIDVFMDGVSCVDPVSDFGDTVCESSDNNVVLYQPSPELAARGKLAVSDMYLGSFDDVSSSSYSSLYSESLGDDEEEKLAPAFAENAIER